MGHILLDDFFLLGGYAIISTNERHRVKISTIKEWKAVYQEGVVYSDYILGGRNYIIEFNSFESPYIYLAEKE